MTKLEAMADAYAKTEEKKKENDDYYFNRSLELQDGFIAGFLAGRNAAAELPLKCAVTLMNLEPYKPAYKDIADLIMDLQKEIKAIGEEEK